ncbi:hypothetical protein CS542_05900 [Pedobacter sp. IW39]|nr:hypothetical protein CS542_05900 [Pedobacter sp. IW39]
MVCLKPIVAAVGDQLLSPALVGTGCGSINQKPFSKAIKYLEISFPADCVNSAAKEIRIETSRASHFGLKSKLSGSYCNNINCTSSTC